MSTIVQVGRNIRIGPLNSRKFERQLRRHNEEIVLNSLIDREIHRKLVFFRSDYLIFDEFFALEFYILFTQFGYKELAELLKQNTWVKNLFTNTTLPLDFNAVEKAGIKLYPYQKQVIIDYARSVPALNLRGFFLALEQGLGKTLTSIALEIARGKKNVVVICPKSLVDQWWETLSNLNGQHACKYVPDKDCKWLILNYEKISTIPENFLTPDSGLIIDEVHNFRNLTTQRTKSLFELLDRNKVQDILLLSGTPLVGSKSDYLVYLLILDPHASMEIWSLWLSIYISDLKALQLLAKYRFTFYFKRITKEEVLKLPKKHVIEIDCKIPDIKRYLWKNIITDIRDEFQRTQSKRLKEYEKRRKEIFELIKQQVTPEVYKQFKNLLSTSVEEAVTYILQQDLDLTTDEKNFLKKMVVKERNFFQSEYLTLIQNTLNRRRAEAIEDIVKHNLKLICKKIDASTKTVIFSTLIKPLHNSVEYICNKCNYDYVIVDGSSPSAVNSEAIRNFQQNEDVKVLGLSQIGAFGLNLTEANTLIVLNSPWRNTTLEQLEDRIHRIGQTSEVYIYILRLRSKELNVHDHMREIAQIIARMIKRYQSPIDYPETYTLENL
ncbi:MAG: SNF2-related protein [Candidatus Micrarchaeaceae archaeon]